jgi:predicted adenine nucleotide alpha hydrolase (AANH) superfamily ATPase
LDTENQTRAETAERVASMLGEIVHQLVRFDLHMKYKKEFIEYFKEICDDKESSIRLKACYNLPCFNLLFKSVEKEFDIQFSEIYLRFT